ncbi:MAG: SusD/RagB family nutrient-binding outer membrane lipoprotein [Pyrinomonadaceae bacterium]|nr:SusD/RagB family nutrient-binding outer membrane lipoprotein [Sphingobacteriaceae bacterium]
MKSIYIKIVSVMIIITALSSCKKYLDINTNPNTAEVVDPKLLFSNAVVNYINVRAAGDLWIPISLTGQAVSSGGNNPTAWGVPSEEQYDVNALSLGNTWRTLYTSTGSNLKEAIKIAESAPVKNNNAAAQSKVLLAMTFYDLTTIYGDVPFSEALNPAIAYPKFDTQQEVLNGVVVLLDQALAQFDDASPLKITDYDLIYKGDLAKWRKLAKSVKLRTLLTMVDKDPSKATAIGQMITAGGMISSSGDNALVKYENTAGRKNPKFGLLERFNGGIEFFHASKWAVDFMNTINDPRLPKFFDKPTTAIGYAAPDAGEDGDDAVHSRIAKSLHSADAPELLFTYQEQLFYEAEVQARGLGVAVNIITANTLYKKAVEESAKYFGVTATASTTFAASLPDLSSLGSNRNAVKYIHYHHWIDKMDRGIDNFTQWRRSGPEGDEVPPITLPDGAPAGGLFRRYEYPVTNEIAANPNAPKAKIKYDAKMWFDL